MSSFLRGGSTEIFRRRLETVHAERLRQSPAEREQALRRLREEFSLPEAAFSQLRTGFEKGENPAQILRTLLAQEGQASKIKLTPPEEANAGVNLRRAVLPQSKAVEAQATPAQIQAVRDFRALVESGQLSAYYDAAIGSGNAALKEKALALFAALPAIGPSAEPGLFVASGLWATAPRRVDDMLNTARYLPGRQVLVRTSIDSDYNSRNFLSYKEGGTQAITYRARIKGEEGDAFLIEVDGRSEAIRVPKQEIYALNQPHDIASATRVKTQYGEGYRLGSWWAATADYNSPLLKAKVAEAVLKIERLVSQLDFSKPNAVEIQKQAVKIIHDTIDMMYPDHGNSRLNANGRSHTNDVGRQAMRGIGMCREQAAVMFAMLAPFQKVLGIDLQFIDGVVYRDTPRAEQAFQKGGTDHGWVQIQYRPQMEMYVIDRTWGQANLPADYAYFGRRGDRYPSAMEKFFKQHTVQPSDVALDGSVTVKNAGTQFPKEGEKVGRENHMRNWQ